MSPSIQVYAFHDHCYNFMLSMIIVTEGGGFLRKCSPTDLRALLTGEVCFQMTAVECAIEFFMRDFMENLYSVMEQDLKAWGQRLDNSERIGRCMRNLRNQLRSHTSSNVDLTCSYLRIVSQIIGLDSPPVLDPTLSTTYHISVLAEWSSSQTVINESRMLLQHLAALEHSLDVRREGLQKDWYLITLVANCKKIQDHLYCSGLHCDFIDGKNFDLSVSVLQNENSPGSIMKLGVVIVDHGFAMDTHDCIHHSLKDAGVSVCTFKCDAPSQPRFHPESSDCSVVFVIAMSGINTGDMERISCAFPQNIPYVSIDMGGWRVVR